jgi:hypothetical protein
MACGLSVVALSACVGGGGDDDGGSVISTGILSLEVPDQESYDALPKEVQNLVDDVVAANAGTAALPTGGTSYHGNFALSVGEGLVWGPAGVNVDFTASNVTYTFEAQQVEDPDNAFAGVSGSISGSATQSGGIFSGGFTDNTIDFDPDTTDGDPGVEITFSGSVDGAFNDSNEVFGGITGFASGPGVDDDVRGVFYAN